MTEYTFIGRDELALKFYLNYLVTIYISSVIAFYWQHFGISYFYSKS